MMEFRWELSVGEAHGKADLYHLCVFDLQSSGGQDKGDEGGRE